MPSLREKRQKRMGSCARRIARRLQGDVVVQPLPEKTCRPAFMPLLGGKQVIAAPMACRMGSGPHQPAMPSLVQMLEGVSETFRTLWHRHEVHAPCQGRRWFNIEGVGPVEFEHTSLIIDESRHLRLGYYAALDE